VPTTEDKPVEEGEKEAQAEGEAVSAPESMEAKMRLYQKLLARLEADNKDSDDEV